MTEQEMTVAVEAAARLVWENASANFPPESPRTWDDLGPLERVEVKEAVMPLALAAAEAVVPIVAYREWAAGLEEGATQAGLCCGCSVHEGKDGRPGNPHPVVL